MNGFAALDIHPHRRYVVDIGGRRSSRCRLHINFALFLRSLNFTQNLGVTPYQRELRVNRVRRIAAKFDPCLLNPPKVSYRNGHYYVFDGQHTVAVLKLLNGGKDLMIRCIVYTGMTESEEALLFAQQTGEIRPADTRR